MGKKFERALLRSLIGIFSREHFRNSCSFTPRQGIELLRRYGIGEKLAAFEEHLSTLDCRRVAALCEELLQALCPPTTADWLALANAYAVNWAFDREQEQTLLPYQDGILCYLAILQAVFSLARKCGQLPPEQELLSLREEELTDSPYGEEYRRAQSRFTQTFAYELMRLSQELTPYRTLEHIAGVHRLALSIGRQLRQAGGPVDIVLLSGAAALHDMGKFGCKPGERVPYLHYYYTKQWCKLADAPAIGHIAANHSVWDLELENLSAESLLLIYGDFRVKQLYDAQGREYTQVYSLQEAFQIILDKLDQVDEAKLCRYRFVYEKLADFEAYLRTLGIDLGNGPTAPTPQQDCCLLRPEQVLQAYRMLGVAHNLNLMHKFGSEKQFMAMLEAARSEKNWQNLRAYLGVIEEYSAYLEPGQKTSVLSFLYELLMHREGDIRRQAAGLIGHIIACFDHGYLKEEPMEAPPAEEITAAQLWQKYFAAILIPDHKLPEQLQSWLGYSLKIVASAALAHCPAQERQNYLQEIWHYLQKPELLSAKTTFTLLDMVPYLPLEYCDQPQLAQLTAFTLTTEKQPAFVLKLAALRVLEKIALLPQGKQFTTNLLPCAQSQPEDSPALAFLRHCLGQACQPELAQALPDWVTQPGVISAIFLDNLKMATHWLNKAVNIRLLEATATQGHTQQLLHIATHLANLIQVSERVVVRHDAGAALVRLAPLLAADQRNEIALELAKGLEIGEYEFSKYIPGYLGQFALWLRPQELDELLHRLETLLSNDSNNVVAVALDTAGVLLECYGQYRGRFVQTQQENDLREKRILGILLKGLASYRPSMRQEALLVIGKSLFAQNRLALEDKRRLFAAVYRKLLFLIEENQEGGLAFYYRAATLNHIYRFITTETLLRGGFCFADRNRLAFFPGTFDPFTLSHKGIIRELDKLGFDVLLAIDEFSWSKNAQPRGIRRRIAIMSLADQLQVQLLPDSLPVNLANPADLRRLHSLFPERELYMVVGSDVVENASSYRQLPSEGSIHHANHIIFSRGEKAEDTGELRDNALSLIDGKIIRLSLPVHLEDISSSRIRENIDRNRDISHLLDPMVQEYIYYNSLYLREPQYKPILRAKSIRFSTVENAEPSQLDALCRRFWPEEAQHPPFSPGHRLLLLHSGDPSQPEGFIAFKQLQPSQFLPELQDLELVEQVRKKTAGKLLLIRALGRSNSGEIDHPGQLLLTEALAWGLEQDCTYCLYRETAPTKQDAAELVARQGFVRLQKEKAAWLVDLRAPLVLIQNLETTLKEPLASNPRVLEAIRLAHHRLQLALTQLYPGNLVFSLSSGVIHHRLIGKICQWNGVPEEPSVPRQLGPYLCAPFGKILRGKAAPNTVTKTIHTDKVFDPDAKIWQIEAYPYYASLPHQIRTIKSFGRPVLLVDDLLHSADRLRALSPLFTQEGVEIRQVLVGLASGRGRDQATLLQREVDSVYTVPNLRHWYVESSLYPFIGGDTVRRESRPVAGLLPSINLILPYAAPQHTESCPRQAVFHFSQVCVENALRILLALEQEYRLLYQRNLTLSRLSEAVILPLCPDKGQCMAYDPNLTASVYLENDLELLLRTEKLYLG